tara:strand:- start:4992 stop:5582 length:591 start_codon:yes stop_codon:yes gene_type:complete
MIKIKNSIVYPGHYSADDCQNIEKICKSFPEQEATVQDTKSGNIKNTVEGNIRKSKVRFIKLNESWGAHELYTELTNLVTKINTEFFNLEIGGVDSIQYTEYDSSYKGHYDWHTDWNWNVPGNRVRKLSMTIQLSDGSEYEGGDFEIALDIKPGFAPTKQLGTVIAFPSFMPHRVTPVTSGLRKSLVVWFTGPPFK